MLIVLHRIVSVNTREAKTFKIKPSDDCLSSWFGSFSSLWPAVEHSNYLGDMVKSTSDINQSLVVLQRDLMQTVY